MELYIPREDGSASPAEIGGFTDWMSVLCPVREGGRDASGEGVRDVERNDGDQDLKLFRMLDLEGKRKKFFFWPDMLVANKEVFSGMKLTVAYSVAKS